ncbi:Uncharacterised protein [Brevibacterium casei]|uniref:Transposase n=1 Tax=Brevibacterium casei TaxID=33889 RepID=A0A449DAY8_9MICO|nr:Uncharacterised protein [Brevibacterium casei]
MNGDYFVWLGLYVGKTVHLACGLNAAGERVLDHELSQDESRLQNAITRGYDEHDSVVVFADQFSKIGAQLVAVDRDCEAGKA